MDEMFPIMLDEPEAHACGTGLAYWLFAFFLIPAILSLSIINPLGLTQEENMIWLEVGYHILNFAVVILTFFGYLKNSFSMAWLQAKKNLGIAAACAAVIVLLKVVIFALSLIGPNVLFAEMAFGTLLTTETDLLYFSTALLAIEPLWGLLCLLVLAPVTVSCLFYASLFAPVCTSRPWLAYVLMVVASGLLHLSLVFCLWPLEQQLAIWLIQIPVHLIACWSFQKTDTIWTPITVHMLSNLAMALLTLPFYIL